METIVLRSDEKGKPRESNSGDSQEQETDEVDGPKQKRHKKAEGELKGGDIGLELAVQHKKQNT